MSTWVLIAALIRYTSITALPAVEFKTATQCQAAAVAMRKAMDTDHGHDFRAVCIEQTGRKAL